MLVSLNSYQIKLLRNICIIYINNLKTNNLTKGFILIKKTWGEKKRKTIYIYIIYIKKRFRDSKTWK